MPPPADVQLGPITRAMLDGAVWREASVFPAHQNWADDLERVLSFLEVQCIMQRFWPRLRARETERDAALSEARTGFFLSRNGFEILKWGPEEVPNRPGDLDVRWTNTEPVFVEVKGPRWEGELTPEEIASGRKNEPKYINAEARAIDPIERIIYAIDKALPKFAATRINLVVVVDDLFISASEIPKELLDGRLTRAFRELNFGSAAGVLLLNPTSYSGQIEVEYVHHYVANPRALRKLPPEVEAGLLAANKNHHGPRWARE